MCHSIKHSNLTSETAMSYFGRKETVLLLTISWGLCRHGVDTIFIRGRLKITIHSVSTDNPPVCQRWLGEEVNSGPWAGSQYLVKWEGGASAGGDERKEEKERRNKRTYRGYGVLASFTSSCLYLMTFFTALTWTFCHYFHINPMLLLHQIIL